MNNRYYLHISSNENRESILDNGLIPKDLINSNQFDKSHRKDLSDSLQGPKIFAVPIGNNIDAYKIIEIRNFIFPIPLIIHGLTEEEYRDLVEKAKINSNFYNSIKNAKKRASLHGGLANLYFEENLIGIENELERELNKILLRESNIFDVWLIDNEVSKNNWEEDPHGSGDEGFRHDSYMTDSRIPPEALDLIAKDNNYTRGELPYESLKNLIPFHIFK